jgi:hypothetical protein
MYDRAAAGIFFQIGAGIDACVMDPAGIRLRAENILRNGGVQKIKPVLIAERHKFKIVVVIQKLQSRLAAKRTVPINFFDCCGKSGAAGAAALIQKRNCDVFAAQRHMVGNDLENVLVHQRQRDMAGNTHQSRLIQHFPDLFGAVSVKAGQLHPIIAHLCQLLQHISRSFCASSRAE